VRLQAHRLAIGLRADLGEGRRRQRHPGLELNAVHGHVSIHQPGRES